MTNSYLLILAKEYDIDIVFCNEPETGVFHFVDYYNRTLYILKIEKGKVDFQNMRGLADMKNFVSEVQKIVDNAGQ